MNTVSRAQELAAHCKALFGSGAVTLIHARFLPEDKAAIEKRLMAMLGRKSEARRDFHIVIGTQVLEQSLDIDFDLLITELCPMDLLLQRIGRLQRFSFTRNAAYKQAQCLILTDENGYWSDGSRAIYGDYLLLRTRALLPDLLNIPASIPELVEKTYDTAYPAPDCSEAYEAYQKRILKQTERAKGFRLTAPVPDETIVGLLDGAVNGIETRALAAVRDIGATLEVIFVWSRGNRPCFPPWIENGSDIPFDFSREPAAAKAVARLSITLPRVLCEYGRLDGTINALEEQTAARYPAWQQSPWLKGALVLTLDEAGEAELCGYVIRYEKEYGLSYKAL